MLGKDDVTSVKKEETISKKKRMNGLEILLIRMGGREVGEPEKSDLYLGNPDPRRSHPSSSRER